MSIVAAMECSTNYESTSSVKVFLYADDLITTSTSFNYDDERNTLIEMETSQKQDCIVHNLRDDGDGETIPSEILYTSKESLHIVGRQSLNGDEDGDGDETDNDVEEEYNDDSSSSSSSISLACVLFFNFAAFFLCA